MKLFHLTDRPKELTESQHALSGKVVSRRHDINTASPSNKAVEARTIAQVTIVKEAE